EFPLPVDEELIRRGKERFTIYCTPCHGQLGDGNGMIAKRGFALRRPVGNYHTERLRKMAVGHFYDVITNGYGSMYSYAARVEPRDRWAIVAYIRALQLSQAATSADKAEADAKYPAPAAEAGH
ncbi:MAG: cytochrome c, partial [Fimbriimonadaceae bacterium]|nr:cytochrome c [Fimbriimonadaceae bacterium]